jgi:hypothetical protein
LRWWFGNIWRVVQMCGLLFNTQTASRGIDVVDEILVFDEIVDDSLFSFREWKLILGWIVVVGDAGGQARVAWSGIGEWLVGRDWSCSDEISRWR